MVIHLFVLPWMLLLSTLEAATKLPEVNGVVGGSVYLPSDGNLPANHQLEWKSGVNIIATRNAGGSTLYYRICPARCELYANATLRIDKILLTDAGNYTVTIKDLISSEVTKAVKLSVYNLLNIPTLTVSTAIRPVNGTNITLQCQAVSQVVHKYFFYQNEQLVSCNPLHLTCNESSPFLYFRPIREDNSGNYTCTIQNPVSSNSSTPKNLDVAVHVSSVSLRNNASSPVVVNKDSVNLTCSAYGTDVSFSWTLRNLPFPKDSRYSFSKDNSTLIISPVTRNDHGSFTCRVANYLNNGTSAPLNLTWLPDGQIVCAAERVDTLVQLLCSWPGGYPAADLQMVFQNLNVTAPDQAFRNVSRDQISSETIISELQCRGNQMELEDSCILIIDSPSSAGYTNNSLVTAPPGKSAILSITLGTSKAGFRDQKRIASEKPQILPASFTWYKLNPEPHLVPLTGGVKVISNNYESYLIIPVLTDNLTGTYQCRAENLMGITSFTFMITAEEVSVPSDDTLTDGAIAGIVIGALGVVSLLTLIIIIFFMLYQKKKAKMSNNQTDDKENKNRAGAPKNNIEMNTSLGSPNIYANEKVLKPQLPPDAEDGTNDVLYEELFEEQ